MNSFKSFDYDNIIGKAITSIYSLQEFAEQHEPSKLEEIKSLMSELMKIDEYMAYGEVN